MSIGPSPFCHNRLVYTAVFNNEVRVTFLFPLTMEITPKFWCNFFLNDIKTRINWWHCHSESILSMSTGRQPHSSQNPRAPSKRLPFISIRWRQVNNLWNIQYIHSNRFPTKQQRYHPPWWLHVRRRPTKQANTQRLSQSAIENIH